MSFTKLLTNYRTATYALADDAERIEILSPALLKRPPTDMQHSTLVGIDNSPSMEEGEPKPKDILNRGILKYLADVQREPVIRSSVLMTFAQFGETSPLALSGPFTTVDRLRPPKLSPSRDTPLCARIIAGVDLLIAGRRVIREQFHVHQRNSWYIEMTDGHPTDLDLQAEARRAVQETAAANGIEVLFFGVGDKANMDFLKSIEQRERPAERLSLEKDFATLFDWLKKSQNMVAASAHGQILEIPTITGSLIRTQG